MNRRGIELSINFLVTFILAIVLFGLGILFAKNLFGGSNELVDVTQEQLDDAIERMFCNQNELVCLNLNSLTLARGDSHVFGVMVLNALPAADFHVDVTTTRFIDKDGNPVPPTGPPANPLDIFPDGLDFTLEKNKEERVGFRIAALPTNPKGKYIVDVLVKRKDPSSGNYENYDVVHKIYITVV